MMTGLIRRSGRYSTRRVIPHDLRAAYGGKREIVKALGTADPAEAKRLHALMWTSLDKEFAERRTRLNVDAVAASPAPTKPTTVDVNAYAALALKAYRRKREQYAADNKLTQFRTEALEQLEVCNSVLEGGEDFGMTLAEAEGMRIGINAALTGEGAAALGGLQPPPSFAPTPPIPQQSPPIYLKELLAKWEAERSPRPRTVRDLTRTISRFEAKIGKLPLQSITKQHVIAFKDALLESKATAANINVIIPFLGTLFNYACDNSIISVNPAKGVKVLNKQRAKDSTGEYAESAIGFAYRPVEHDRLNALMRYTCYYDQPVPGQSTAAGDGYGPAQRSHIFSADMIYDVTPNFSLGLKYGARLSHVRLRDVTEGLEHFGQWQRSDAHLGIVRADMRWTRQWDVLAEGRVMHMPSADTVETGAVLAVYRRFTDQFRIGAGYNWGRFSDDLRDQTLDDRGWFINILGVI